MLPAIGAAHHYIDPPAAALAADEPRTPVRDRLPPENSRANPLVGKITLKLSNSQASAKRKRPGKILAPILIRWGGRPPNGISVPKRAIAVAENSKKIDHDLNSLGNPGNWIGRSYGGESVGVSISVGSTNFSFDQNITLGWISDRLR
jgi:hypothetical protein